MQRQEIIAYFQELDRSYFTEESTGSLNTDSPVPIGFGQTMSQPTLVLNMTIALDLFPDARVLEIGTGSGYQTALIAPFCREIYTVERIEHFYHTAQERLNQLGMTNIHYKLGDGSFGWKKYSPYDRIIVTAAVSKVPDELLEQLAKGGKMVIPVGDKLQLIEKQENEEITTTTIEHVAFVKLKGKYE